jgi:hypothetical protein
MFIFSYLYNLCYGDKEEEKEIITIIDNKEIITIVDNKEEEKEFDDKEIKEYIKKIDNQKIHKEFFYDTKKFSNYFINDFFMTLCALPIEEKKIFINEIII